MELRRLLDLTPHGADVFVGTGPRYHWGGLYGGQIVAQALRAAALTVDDGFSAHSMRAYFIRRGDHTEPIRFEVDRLRNGTGFATRRVVARQANGAILNLESSFQREQPAPDVESIAMPSVPPPEDITEDSWTTSFHRRVVPEGSVSDDGRNGAGRSLMWLRAADPLGDDQLVHRCAVAYMSDDLPTEAVVRAHPDSLGAMPITWAEFDLNWFSASLDHSMWFHRPVAADEWHLYDFTCLTYSGGRGLTLGHVFSRSGIHVATVTQEVLVRERRAK